jgi:L-asparaginase/Glu-tRNA(Gln) amidotransferase subunit D
VVACGGSIESRRDDGGHKRVVGGIDDLVAATGRAVEIRRFALRPSFSFDLTALVRLSETVAEVAADRTAVVTFGTDLMEEAAFVLDLLAPAAGVVLTGAVGDAAPESDAGTNLAAAIDLADAGTPRCCAFLSFAGEIRRGYELVVVGVGSDPFAAGDGLSRSTPLPRPAVPSRFASVALIEASPVGAIALPDVDVVVVRAYAAGNVPPPMASSLHDRLASGGVVVLCATSPDLGARQTSVEHGGGGALVAAGARHAGRLTPRKAAVLAAFAFGHDGNPASFDAVIEAIE